MAQRIIKVDGKVRTDETYPAGFMGKSFGSSLFLRLRGLGKVETFCLAGRVPVYSAAVMPTIRSFTS
jgi:hypothetical protein